MTFIPSDWYWIVDNNNPTTLVFSSASNAFVANNSAAYLTWLANSITGGAQTQEAGTQFGIVAVSDNGAGLYRLTISFVPTTLKTGQRWQVVGTGTTADGTWPITVVSTGLNGSVDLQGSTFGTTATTGVLTGATMIDTAANLAVAINNSAVKTQAANTVEITASADFTLTLPLPKLVRIRNTKGADLTVNLCQMNAPRSPPLGEPFRIAHIGGDLFRLNIRTFLGSIIAPASTGILAGEAIDFYLLTNTDTEGTFEPYYIPVEDGDITNAKLRDSGALSVIGRSANSSGDPADISASAASGAVLRESGSTIGFGTVATAGIADDAVTNAKLANMANSTIKGRTTAGTGDPEDLTGAQAAGIVLGAMAVQVFTSGGTYTAGANCTKVLVMCKGGGGSGGGCTVAGGAGGGGGEGEESWKLFSRAAITGQTVTIGAGGSGIAANTNSNGNTGSTTSVGTLITAVGGGGGASCNNNGPGGSGGTGGTKDWGWPGGAGGSGSINTATATFPPQGGGKGGGANLAAGAANSGGGGGGGFSTTNGSGAGGSGIAVFYEF